MVSRILASFAIFVGLFLIVNAILPIAFYEIAKSPRFSSNLLSPIPSKVTKTAALDLTHASNWFIGAPNEETPFPSKIRYYTISIPKLGIEDATVEIAGEDLSKNLIHYKGTTLPGRVGNTVIFGHSVLTQFFNPQNYLTIFSTLPTMTVDDEVELFFDGVTYKYRVFEMSEVAPTDFSVLEQSFSESVLTLITCVPPGTYLRRLVVRARIL